MKILIVEDDLKIAQFLKKGLSEEGYAPDHFADGEEAYQALLEEDWDILIVDRMLPGLDGAALCRKLRQIGKKTPILMLTAMDSVEDRVSGLDAGADDYLVKPFAFTELLARLRALTRRPGQADQTALQSGELSVDLVRHKASYQGREIDLTSREFSLLEFFMRRPGHALSRTVIAESVWGRDFQGGTNVIDVYVNYLRKKLKKMTGKEYVKTIRNRGYVFEEAPE